MAAESPEFRDQLEAMTSRLVALERRATTLAELNRLLSRGSDPLELAQRAVDLVMRATKAAGTYVYRWDSSTERLVMRVATSGRVSGYLGTIQLRLGEGINGWAALMRQVVVINDDIASDPRYFGFPGIEEDEFRSMVVVPIVAPGGGLLGVFSLYSEQPEAFNRHAVELATEVGDLLASGLVHAEKLEDLRRESAAARFLANLPADSTTSLQRCVDEIAREIREQIDADLCVVELADPGGGDPPVRPGLALAEGLDRAVADAARSVKSRATLPPLVQMLGERLSKISSTFGTRFPEGAVTCYRSRAFSTLDEELLEAIATQSGVLTASMRQEASAAPLVGRLAAGNARELLRDIGWRGEQVYPVVLALRALRYGTPAAFEQVVRTIRAVASSHDGVLIIPSAPVVTLLVPASYAGTGFESALRLAAQQHRLELAVGVGPIVRDENNAVSALLNAELALGWAKLMAQPFPVVHHAEIAHLARFPQVALDLGEDLGDAVRRFAAVVEYDHRQGTNLAGTLDCYLATRCSMGETAKALFIHRNTLRQRLARIEEIAGRSVYDFGDWVVVSLAARMSFAGGRPSVMPRSEDRPPV